MKLLTHNFHRVKKKQNRVLYHFPKRGVRRQSFRSLQCISINANIDPYHRHELSTIQSNPTRFHHALNESAHSCFYCKKSINKQGSDLIVFRIKSSNRNIEIVSTLTNSPDTSIWNRVVHCAYVVHKWPLCHSTFDCATLWLVQFYEPIICLTTNHLLTMLMTLSVYWK